jgi:hypothetical protein
VILENVSFYYYYFHYFSVIITYIHSVVNLMQEEFEDIKGVIEEKQKTQWPKGKG